MSGLTTVVKSYVINHLPAEYLASPAEIQSTDVGEIRDPSSSLLPLSLTLMTGVPPPMPGSASPLCAHWVRHERKQAAQAWITEKWQWG